jgi:hypothetical protein
MESTVTPMVDVGVEMNVVNCIRLAVDDGEENIEVAEAEGATTILTVNFNF